MIFSKVGGLSFGLSLWGLCGPRVWHVCVRVNRFHWFCCELQCSVGLWYLTLWTLMYFLDILIKIFNSSTSLLHPDTFFVHSPSRYLLRSYYDCVLCLVLGRQWCIRQTWDLGGGQGRLPRGGRQDLKKLYQLDDEGNKEKASGRGKSKGKNPLAKGNRVI